MEVGGGWGCCCREESEVAVFSIRLNIKGSDSGEESLSLSLTAIVEISRIYRESIRAMTQGVFSLTCAVFNMAVL